MKSEELKANFDTIAKELFETCQKLQNLEQEVKYQMDKKAIQEIITSLNWATENCTVIGLHQVDQALEDNMGTGLKN